MPTMSLSKAGAPYLEWARLARANQIGIVTCARPKTPRSDREP